MSDEVEREDGAEEPQEEKKSSSDWITAEVPKVSREPKAAPAPKGEPPIETVPDPSLLKDDIESTIVEGIDDPGVTMPAAGAMGAGASASASTPSPAMASESTAGGSNVPLGGVLENIGITEERTQKIVVYGCGALILLSCLCACLGVALTQLGNLNF